MTIASIFRNGRTVISVSFSDLVGGIVGQWAGRIAGAAWCAGAPGPGSGTGAAGQGGGRAIHDHGDVVNRPQPVGWLNLTAVLACPWTYKQDFRVHLGLLADTEHGVLLGAWAVARWPANDPPGRPGHPHPHRDQGLLDQVTVPPPTARVSSPRWRNPPWTPPNQVMPVMARGCSLSVRALRRGPVPLDLLKVCM